MYIVNAFYHVYMSLYEQFWRTLFNLTTINQT